MRTWLLLAALLASAVPAWAQDVVVRSHVEPSSGAVIGQHVRVMVDVLFRDGMVRPPRVSLGEVPGAQLLRFESQATTMSDTVDGRTYSGQRFEFALYARRGGVLSIPAPQVVLVDGNGGETGRRQGNPAKVDISIPTGVDPSRPVIATTRLTLDETWTPSPASSFKAGDAVVRTITREAADVPGMAMLDLDFAAPPGSRVYVDAPRIEDRQDRGEVTGRRVDRATYVFERAGSFAIPALNQPWWDFAGKSLRQSRASSVTLNVSGSADVRSSNDRRIERAIFLATAVVGFLMFIWWASPRVVAAQRQRQARWQRSEAKAFHDLEKACRQDDPAAIYPAFVLWRQRRAGKAVPAALAKELELALFAGRPWTRGQGMALLRKVEILRRGAAPGRFVRPVLPPLNPGKRVTS